MRTQEVALKVNDKPVPAATSLLPAGVSAAGLAVVDAALATGFAEGAGAGLAIAGLAGEVEPAEEFSDIDTDGNAAALLLDVSGAAALEAGLLSVDDSVSDNPPTVAAGGGTWLTNRKARNSSAPISTIASSQLQADRRRARCGPLSPLPSSNLVGTGGPFCWTTAS